MADASDPDNAWLRLYYRVNGQPVDYKVRLVTTKPNYGGLRWWFICPIALTADRLAAWRSSIFRVARNILEAERPTD